MVRNLLVFVLEDQFCKVESYIQKINDTVEQVPARLEQTTNPGMESHRT